MAYNDSFRNASELTAVARAALETQLSSFQLPAWLPNVDNFGLTYNFNINVLQVTDAATFRAFDTEAPFGRVPGSQQRSGQLPPISRKLRITEYDQLRVANQPDAIGLKEEDYAERVGAQIGARLALAQGQVVETGLITLAENNLSFTIDFGRSGGNTVTAGTLWSTISAPAVTDLTNWKATYVALNGYPPAVAMMSSAIMAALQKNTSVILAATGQAAANAPLIISQAQVRAFFVDYGFGRIVLNDDVVAVAGATTRIIGSTKLVWLPESGGVSLGGAGGTLGSTDFGIPSEALDSKYGIADGDKPGLFAAALDSDDPSGLNVLGSAIALPVLSAANATFAAAVI